MFTKKIASLTLASMMVFGGGSVSAFATSEDIIPVEVTVMSLEEFNAQGHTVEGLKAIKEKLELKGLTLTEAKDNFEIAFNEIAETMGMTAEEAKDALANFKENGGTLEGLKAIKTSLNEKEIALSEAKDNFEVMFDGFVAKSELDPDAAKETIQNIKNNGGTLEGLKKAANQE